MLLKNPTSICAGKPSRFSTAALVFCVVIFCSAGLSFAFTLPDTGQTVCYDSSGNTISCTGTGQDGAYVKHRNYTDNGSTVTDNITGLEWQKCNAARSGSDCSAGTAAIYNWYEATGTYESSYNKSGYSVCTALYGSDWRLPTMKELVTLVNYGVQSPDATITATYFPNTEASYHWSSNVTAAASYGAWGVHFGNGNVLGENKIYDHNVRCVRGAQSTQTYTLNDGGTVTDNSTGLIWQRCTAGRSGSACESGSAQAYNWYSASGTYHATLNPGSNSVCKDLYGSEWRLPDAMELESLTDESRYNPAINPIFATTETSCYWTSTTFTNNASFGRNVSFYYGTVDVEFKTEGQYNHVRCVSGGHLVVNDAVKIEGTTNYYSTIKAAYDTDGEEKTILAQAIDLGENLQLADGKDITLIGGYNSGFTANAGYTKISRLRIGGADRLTIANVIIK